VQRQPFTETSIFRREGFDTERSEVSLSTAGEAEQRKATLKKIISLPPCMAEREKRRNEKTRLANVFAGPGFKFRC